jgi:hypothetical protein
MKFLIVLLLLPSCQTKRELVTASGVTYRDDGHLAGDTLVMIEPDGTVILRNKMNKPWQDFLQTVAASIVSYNGASVSKANISSDEAKRLGSLKATTANNAINAEVEKLKITTDASTEALKILNPTP